MATLVGTDGMTYTFENGVLTVTGAGTSSALYQGVVRGPNDTSMDVSTATKVVYGEGITVLGSQQFFGKAQYLTEIIFPSTLAEIGDYNFYPPSNLHNVRIPAGVVTIGKQAFIYGALSEVIFEGQPTTIKDQAFQNTNTPMTVYSTGWANSTTFPSSITGSVAVTFVTGVPLQYDYIKVNNRKVQVESAVRDEDGARIKTKYAKKSELFSGSYSDLTDKPTIPDELADLTADSTHRLVTDAEKSAWNGKQDALTFDSAPTANSTNPVTSGGVKTALDGYLPLTGGTLTGPLTLTGTNGITSNNIVFLDWKINVARLASAEMTYFVGLVGGATGWLKVRSKTDILNDFGINDKQDKNTIVSNTAVSSWDSDNTYPDYPYRASIAITGVTASDMAEVVFGLDQAISGDYAPVCETYAGGVYVYSAVNTAITIPTIIVFKG